MRIGVTKKQAKWADEAATRGNVLKLDPRTGRISEVAKEASREEKMRRALEQFANCDLNEGNCASLEVATKRIRILARQALAD